jgi:hypothetical protein
MNHDLGESPRNAEEETLIMRILLILTFLFAVSAPPVQAQTGDVSDQVFGAIEKKIIEDFFGEQAADAVSGTKKNKTKKNKNAKEDGGKKNKNVKNKDKSGELPPGLQKHIEKHGTLPPGLAKKELPPGLAKRLGSTKSGLERLIVGDDVLLVEQATGVVLDIIKDIVTERDK